MGKMSRVVRSEKTKKSSSSKSSDSESTSGSFKRRLQKAKALWAKASQRVSQFGSEVEDGIYRMRVSKCSLGESAGSGRLQVSWQYTVIEGEEKGSKVSDYQGLDTEDGFYFLRLQLIKLGYEDDIPEEGTPEDLEALLEKIADDGPVVRARVQTKDDFTHVRVLKLLEDDESENEDEDEDEDEDEEEEAEEDETEEVSLQQGMKVSFTQKGKDHEGEILKFVDDDTVAKIADDDGKIYKVAIDELTPLEEENEAVDEPEEEEDADADDEPAPKKGKVRKIKK